MNKYSLKIKHLIIFLFIALCLLGVLVARLEQTRNLGLILIAVSVLLIWFTEKIDGIRSVSATYIKLPRFTFLLIAFLLCITSAFLPYMQLGLTNTWIYDATLILWLAGSVIIFFTFFRISREQVFSFYKTYRKEIFLVFVFTIIAAFLRLYKLDSILPVLNGDDGWTGMAALNKVANNNAFSFFHGFGRVYLNLIQLSINIFGQNKFGLRFIPAVGGIMAIPATYILSRYLFGIRTAKIAAFLLTVSHAHIHFSRAAAVGYIQSTWLAPLELYLFLSGMREKNSFKMVIGGLLLGLHLNFYYGAQILTGFLIIYILLLWCLKKSVLRKDLKYVSLFFFSAFILALPVIVWSVNHQEEFSARWAMEGTFQSNWFFNEMLVTGKPALVLLIEHFLHAFLTIIAIPFEDFYWAPVPVLHFASAVFFILGLFVALRRIVDLNMLFLNGWFWSALFSISIFAVPPSADSYRLLMVLPAILIFTSLGLNYILTLTRYQNHREMIIPLWTIVLLSFIAALNLKIYFLDVAGNCRYMNGQISARGASLIGDYLNQQRPFKIAYMLGNEDYRHGILPSMDYLAGTSAPIENILQPFVYTLLDTNIKGRIIFIIIPEREQELENIRVFAPGGTITRISDCDRLAFIGYKIETN